MKLRHKKGFTIIELVIVIAVIGILTAVLVPTFINLTAKANKAADDSLVKNLNTALKMEEQTPGHKKSTTLQGAIDDLEEQGYLLENLVSKSGQDLLWDQEKNEFTLNNDAELQGAKYWQIVDAIPANQRFSYYAGQKFTSSTVNPKYGFDAGDNTCVETINFVDSEEKTVNIRTNGIGTKLVVNAPLATVHHYDYLNDLTVTAIANASYHEHGTVRGKAILSQGHIEIEEGATVPQVLVENVPEGKTAKITANERTIISVDDDSKNQTTVLANSDNVFVSGLAEDKVTGDAVIAESVTNEETLLAALESGYVQLDGDITLNSNLTISNTAVIDLKGHTFTVNGLILNNGDLTIDDSKDNGQKKVSNVVNDAVSAKTSTNVSTESSLSYTKNLQGTLNVESIITSSNHKLSVLNGSFVSELDYHKYFDGEKSLTNGLIRVEENATAVIYNGAFFSENLEDATEQYAAAAVAVVANYGNTTIYKGEFVTKYCRESYDTYFDGPTKPHSVASTSGLYNKDRMQYSYYTLCSWGGSITMSPKTNDDLVVYAARGAISFNSGNAEIKGGKYYAYHFYAAYIAGAFGNVKGTISGGEFNLVDGGHLSGQYALSIGNDTAGDGGKRLPANVVILDCIVNSDKNAIKVANSTGTIVVYGGKYDKPISEDYIDTNSYRIVNEDGYYVVKAK